MRSRRLLTLLLVLGILAIFCLLLMGFQPGPQLPPTATQFGFTNGTVGRLTPAFRKSAPKNADFVQEWLRTGTNAVLFHVVNRREFPIWLFPYAKMDIKGSAPTNYLTFLTDAKSTHGIYLDPGEAATLQLPELPAHGLSQATFSYSRATVGNSWPARLRRWWGVWRGFVTTKSPENFQLFYSDWFNQ